MPSSTQPGARVQPSINFQQGRGGKRRERDEQDRQSNDGLDVIRLHRLHEHVSDASLRSEHLADKSPEQRERKAETKAGHDLRHDRRDDYSNRGLQG